MTTVIILDSDEEVGTSTRKKNQKSRQRGKEEAANGTTNGFPNGGRSYEDWCLYQLSAEFPKAKMSSIKIALSIYGKLALTYEALRQGYEQVSKGGQSSTGEFKLLLNKHQRICRNPPSSQCPQFMQEWEAIKKSNVVSLDSPSSSQLSATQGFECGCCFSEYPFEQLVQCADAHLFCFGCVRRHVEEAAFGGAQASGSLACMDTDGCTESFPWSEVRRALPEDVLTKYESRLAEDSVARALLTGLVYCPFCNMPWEVDPELKVLNCQNLTCQKSSCLACKEPNHAPLLCHEVEKTSETAIRRQVEERMTKALIRECSSCKAELVKEDGCNKIVCRCGQRICYVCRKPINNDYRHFCQHPRQPGKACNLCNKCGLWVQEVSDDIVEAEREAAKKEAADKDPNIFNRNIGPDDNKRKKKRKRGRGGRGA